MQFNQIACQHDFEQKTIAKKTRITKCSVGLCGLLAFRCKEETNGLHEKKSLKTFKKHLNAKKQANCCRAKVLCR